jgi:hypothetical protein
MLDQAKHSVERDYLLEKKDQASARTPAGMHSQDGYTLLL